MNNEKGKRKKWTKRREKYEGRQGWRINVFAKGKRLREEAMSVGRVLIINTHWGEGKRREPILFPREIIYHFYLALDFNGDESDEISGKKIIWLFPARRKFFSQFFLLLLVFSLYKRKPKSKFSRFLSCRLTILKLPFSSGRISWFWNASWEIKKKEIKKNKKCEFGS